MTSVIKTKDQEQRKALNSWAKAGFTGSIIAGTGFGKSRCGVLAVAHSIDEHDSKGNALIIVPTQQLQEQFKEEFIKWGYEDMLEHIEVMCYQSAYKLTDKHYNVVVCDEIHLGLSPEYRKFFENNSYY